MISFKYISYGSFISLIFLEFPNGFGKLMTKKQTNEDKIRKILLVIGLANLYVQVFAGLLLILFANTKQETIWFKYTHEIDNQLVHPIN